MAFKLGRKLGKLDAICANLKLKQNSCIDTAEPEEKSAIAKTLTNGALDDAAASAPTDLSLRSNNNNNIVGKADLNSLEEDEGENAVKSFTEKDATELYDKPLDMCAVNDNGGDEDISIPAEETDKDSPIINCKDKSIELKEMVNAMREKKRAKVMPVSTSRRKSRKPKSITQVRDFHNQLDEKDELAEYEINNQNTDFPPEDCDDSEKDASSSGRESLTRSFNYEDRDSPKFFNNSDSSIHSNEFTKLTHSRIAGATLSSAPLDLSVHKNKEDEASTKDDCSSDDDDVENPDSHYKHVPENREEDYFHPHGTLVIDEEQTPSSARNSKGNALCEAPKSNEQVNHLKDFAESTMNELISMYGFGGAHPNDLSKHVPKEGYKNILKFSANSQEGASPSGVPSVGGAGLRKQPLVNGDEVSHDRSTPVKGIYANYVKSGATLSGKPHGKTLFSRNT